MKTTLITSVGTGMYKDGYKKTNYVFPNGREIETHIFLNALLSSHYRDFSKIILAGTVTSGWDMLVDVDNGLWEKVLEAKENGGVPDSLLKEVEKYLSKKLSLPVIIKCHTDKIDDDSSEEIFDLYSSIVPEITDENVLFDITHGFRSMPILLYQALQFAVSQNPKIRNVEIVYGEYKPEEKLSYVRELSSYWKYSQVSDALNVFDTKLDGFRLADLIQDEWERGSKAIRRFSQIVQTNFCLQIAEAARQIRNALKKYPENAPAWLSKVRGVLEKILKTLGGEDLPVSETLFNFSKFLYEHKLNVQAVICLQVAVESRICESENLAEKIGDYDWWQKNGRAALNKIKFVNYDNRKQIGVPLNNLEDFRNKVAHGGAKNKEGNFPNAMNISNIYKSGRRGAENLFTELPL